MVLAGRRLEKLEETAAMADRSGGQTLAVAADVSQPDSVDTLFSRTRDAFGRIDVLFNNAGAGAPAMARAPVADFVLSLT